MKQVLITLLVVPLVASGALALLNWVFRRRGSNFSVVVSVISQWLVLAVIWTLLGQLLQSFGALEEPGRALYTRSPLAFGIFALILGTWQYRLARAGAAVRASRLFLWSQVGWFVIMLTDHGVFR